MKNNYLSGNQRNALNEIISTASKKDHMVVAFRLEQLEMAKTVIANMEAKLKEIAELARMVLDE